MNALRSGRTKIVCTLGPSSRTIDMLTSLIRAGMDVARLNFSHGTHEDHLSTIQNVREASNRCGVPVTIVQDLQGPKIRIGDLGVPMIELRAGDRFTITTEPVVGTGKRVSTTYTDLTKDVHPGDIILIDDGKVRLNVVGVEARDVVCEVVIGGLLSAHKGINLPGVALSTPSLTPKDIGDLEFGLMHDVDYVALSFVRSANDIRRLRSTIQARLSSGAGIPIIAKIEKPEAVTKIDEIIGEADGIMIARGDLGVELPPEDVPVLQKKIIAKCNSAGKPVIVATQMLESMINNPTPTRAEASDVANAVVDGCDAVMLSGETSVGRYPIEAVQIMDRITKKVEEDYSRTSRSGPIPHRGGEGKLEALSHAACVLAGQMRAAAIVAVTRSGKTAKVLSRFRPGPPIVAITDNPKILRQISLFWGVQGVIIDALDSDSDKALQTIQDHLTSSGLVRQGEYFVLLGGQPFFKRGSTNFIKVECLA